MNNRSSANERNLVKFSTEMSTVTRLDSKDGLLSFPFDHIYACQTSDNSNQTSTIEVEKEVEISTHCIISEDNNQHNLTEITNLQSQLHDFENQNKQLKDLLNSHLDMIQQQNELITRKDKLYQSLRQENDTLKAELIREEHGVSISARTKALNAAYHKNLQATSTVTSSTPKLTTSQILFKNFPELMQPSSSGGTQSTGIDQFQETFGIARISSEPEPEVKPSFTMGTAARTQAIECKKSRRSERVAAERQTQENTAIPGTSSMYSASGSSSTQRGRKTKRRSSSETSGQKDNAIKRRSAGRTSRRSKRRRTASINTTIAHSPPSIYTGSLSSRLQLIEPTPTGEDPYQLGEADMREQSPIPKLVLSKSSYRQSRREPPKVNKEPERERFILPLFDERNVETAILDDPDVDIIKTETDIDWQNNADDDLCGFPNSIGDNFSSMPSLDTDFQNLFEFENLDTLQELDCPPLSPTLARNLDCQGHFAMMDEEPPVAGDLEGQRRNSVTFPMKYVGKSVLRGGRASLQHASESPTRGVVTHKPYHTALGHPDLTWYLGLDPDIKLDDLDIVQSGQPETVEVPRWREMNHTSSYTLEGTENVTEKMFEKRHSKLEAEERRQLSFPFGLLKYSHP
ncbi:uncharacterized protein LOC126978684 isoform X2 [Leptidea sinapis]|uniref:uncharacterized protein LOC126978684 isoform X2 n=1 Tax=Leptidea sinapis TaxID=189913 RepID=UPI002131202F|nr:uncharacterized protein LOC126978684 isoform X2 [Leptidea sinapis]